MQSEKIDELLAARDKAQLEICAPVKDAVNSHFKQKYATLDKVWESFGEPLRKNGLEIVQQTYVENGHCFLYIRLIHVPSGQWLGSQFPLGPITGTSQAMGSAITYMKRYSLCTLIRPASEEDDDGNAASNLNEVKRPSAQQKEKEWESKIGKDQEYLDKILAFYKVEKLSSIDPSYWEAVDRSVNAKFGKK